MAGNGLDTETFSEVRNEMTDDDEPLFTVDDNNVVAHGVTPYLSPGSRAAEIVGTPIGSTPYIEVYDDHYVVWPDEETARQRREE